jgi:cytidylate kinase
VDRLTSSDRGEIDQVVARLNPAVENGRLHLDAVPASGLKEPWIAERASRIAACAEVRQVLTDRLRRLVAERDCVLSGRDGGSAICPAATLKFFLTASPEVRATRRSGSDLSRRSAAEQNNRRDRRDSDRVSAPLLVPAGAIVLDTSNETQAETLLKLVGFVRANDPANARACL